MLLSVHCVCMSPPLHLSRSCHSGATSLPVYNMCHSHVCHISVVIHLSSVTNHWQCDSVLSRHDIWSTAVQVVDVEFVCVCVCASLCAINSYVTVLECITYVFFKRVCMYMYA